MYDFIAPDSIQGLNLWFDASDYTTINDGRVTNGTNVYKFVDKVSGVVLTNGSGVNGPTYSYKSVNNRNSIVFANYGTVLQNGIKGLTATNVTQLQSTTCSMFCVYKPFTKSYTLGTIGNQSYVVAIWDKASLDANSRRGYPVRAFYLGDEGAATAAQKTNPSARFVEAYQNAANLAATGYTLYNTYTEHIFSRSLEGPRSDNVVCLASSRLQNGPKKIGYILENSECMEEVTVGVSEAQGFFVPSKITGTFSQLTNSNQNVNGTNTLFVSELIKGDDLYYILNNTPTYIGKVFSVINNTQLQLYSATQVTPPIGATFAVGVNVVTGAGSPKSPSPFSTDRNYYKVRGYKITGTASSPDSPAAFVIGAHWPYPTNFDTVNGGLYPLEGYFCEFLNYDRYLNEEETNSIREYLKNKWFPKQ